MKKKPLLHQSNSEIITASGQFLADASASGQPHAPTLNRPFMPADNVPFAGYGRHLLLNFAGCQVDLNDLAQIRADMIAATTAVGAIIIAELAHRFQPQGVSVVLMLSESHASVHTYPEYHSCFLDIFTCGKELRVERFGELLAARWCPERVSQQLVERREP